METSVILPLTKQEERLESGELTNDFYGCETVEKCNMNDAKENKILNVPINISLLTEKKLRVYNKKT